MSRTPEDLLRDALRGGDEPAGAGSFDDVRARARKLDRRARVLKAGVAAIVLLAAVGVSIPLLGGNDEDEGRRVVTNPGPDHSTTTAVSMDLPIGIWPFATAGEADDETIDLSFMNPADPASVAKVFLSRVAGMPVVSIEPDTASARQATVVASNGPRHTTVHLRKLGTSDRWTVVGAESDGLQLDEPAVDFVSSPVHVSGVATAFEGTVLVRVTDRALTPNELGRGVLTGEMGELKPFSGEVTFQPDEGGLGAVIAVTESAKDGSVEQVAAAPIRWQQSRGAAASPLPVGEPLDDYDVVAVLDEDVPDGPDLLDVVVLADDGSVRRTLLDNWDTAEGGVLDLAVSPDRRTVLASLATSACTSEIRAFAADGSSSRVLGSGDRVALSPDGAQLAVGIDPECDGIDVLEIRDLVGYAATRHYNLGGGILRDLTWSDPQTVVYDLWHEDESVNVHVRTIDGHERLLVAPPGKSWSMPGGGAAGNVRLLLSNGDVVRVKVSSGEIVNTVEQLGNAKGVFDLGETFYLLWLTSDRALHARVPPKSDATVLRRNVGMIADMPRIAG